MHQLTKDPLTGAYRRDAFPAYLQHFLNESERTEHPFSVVLIDVDHFKQLNDAFGHARGDEVLSNVIDRASGAIRDEDLLFRYGGDEFVLLLPATDKAEALRVSERILKRVVETPFSGDPPLSVTLSIGIATYPEDGQSEDKLFEQADARMYLSKRQGRGKVTSHDIHVEAGLQFDDEGRLLEREEALTETHAFLKELRRTRRGVLELRGPPGAGHSRFLLEVQRLATLQGYLTLSLTGTPARQGRHLGALLEARLSGDPLPTTHPDELVIEVRQALFQGRTGLLITVEQLQHLDQGSRQFLDALLTSDLPVVGLAHATSPGTAPQHPEVPHRREADLPPLSKGATSLWLRTVLQTTWPPDLIRWFRQATRGLPAVMKAALVALSERGHLQHTADGWQLVGEDGIDLESLLEGRVAPSKVPSWETPLIGRHQLLHELSDLLERERLISLIGPSGIGKSRLAAQLARENLTHFPGGVFFVPLTNATPGNIPLEIAKVLGLSLAGVADVLTAVGKRLSGERTLLVLDDIEQLLDAPQIIAELLTKAPPLSLVLTSKGPLRLEGEVSCTVPGLATPPTAATKGFEGFAAVQLFLTQAQRAGMPITLDSQNRQAILRICEFTDASPLGLELAASWSPVLDPTKIAARLDDAPELLPAAPGQSGRLWRILDYLRELLSEDEQKVLWSLAIFPGRFGVEAAREVAGASPFFLLALRDRHLLFLENGRYRMHELMRQYAVRNLPESNQAALKTRLAVYCSEVAHGYLKDKANGEDLRVFTLLDAELANFKLAWRWSAERGHYQQLTPLARLLRSYLDVRGLGQEGLKLFAEADELLAAQANADPLAHGWILEALALFHYHAHLMDDAATYARQARERLAPLDESEAHAITHNTLGMIAAEAGEPTAARENFEQARAIYQRLGHRLGVARMLGNIATVTDQMGNKSDARRAYQTCISLHRELGNRSSLAINLINYGSLLMEVGAWREAQPALQEALDITTEISYPLAATAALKGLARAAHHANAYTMALNYLQEALELARGVGNPAQIAGVQLELARNYQARHAGDEAENHLAAALELAGRHQLENILREGLLLRAQLLADRREDAAAAELLGSLQNRGELHSAQQRELESLVRTLTERRGEEVGRALERGSALDPSAFMSAPPTNR